MPRYNDDFHILPAGLDFLKYVDSSLSGEPDIQKHYVNRLSSQKSETLRTVAGQKYLLTLVSQDIPENILNGGLVVDDKYSVHAFSPEGKSL